MRLNTKEFKEFNELKAKLSSGAITDAESKRLAALTIKKEDRSGSNSGPRRNGKQDASWYTKYKGLAEAAENIAFNSVAGDEINFAKSSGQGSDAGFLPTGLRIEFMPTIGRSTEKTDAFNTQMRKLWLLMHRKYRGMGKYQSSDLGMFIFSTLCLFGDIARAERVYGCLTLFSTRNKSYPTHLLQALGLSSTVTADNLADFRYRLNVLIEKAKTLCLPKGFAFLDMLAAIQGQVFKDADTVRAQWFLYDSPYKIKYNHTKHSTGGCVEYLPRTIGGGLSGQTLDNILSDLADQINSLYEDDDAAIMASDIIAAFGNDVTGLEYMPENYKVTPVRSDERLLQLHNTTPCGYVVGGGFSNTIKANLTGNPWLDVYQESNIIKQRLFVSKDNSTPAPALEERFTDTGNPPTATGVWYATSSGFGGPMYYTGSPIMDTWNDEPTGDEKMELTRQLVKCQQETMINCSPDGGTTMHTNRTLIEMLAYGNIVVLFMKAYQNSSLGTVASPLVLSNSVLNMSGTPSVLDASLAAISKLDWFPLLIMVRASQYVGILGDMDNYKVISTTDLQALHHAACMSLFKIENSEFDALDVG